MQYELPYDVQFMIELHACLRACSPRLNRERERDTGRNSWWRKVAECGEGGWGAGCMCRPPIRTHGPVLVLLRRHVPECIRYTSTGMDRPLQCKDNTGSTEARPDWPSIHTPVGEAWEWQCGQVPTKLPSCAHANSAHNCGRRSPVEQTCHYTHRAPARVSNIARVVAPRAVMTCCGETITLVALLAR